MGKMLNMAKKSEKNIVSCAFCKNAELHKFFDNPIIAYCVVKKVPNVALSKRVCSNFDIAIHHNKVYTHQSYKDKVPWKRQI